MNLFAFRLKLVLIGIGNDELNLLDSVHQSYLEKYFYTYDHTTIEKLKNGQSAGKIGFNGPDIFFNLVNGINKS